MSEHPIARRPDEVAQQWQALAERRREHLLELHSSGRWQRYYSEEALALQMQNANRCIAEWGSVAGNGMAPMREAAE